METDYTVRFSLFPGTEMNALLLLVTLTAGSIGIPSWNPSVEVPARVLEDFQAAMERLPEHLRPADPAELNCFWATSLVGLGLVGGGTATLGPNAAEVLAQARKYAHEKCRGPGGPGGTGGAVEKFIRAIQWLSIHDGTTGLARDVSDTAPFHLPPLPDRAGGDLGVQVGVMFAILEARLAAGGHQLTVGRSCALASGALSAAEAVQRSPATATEGIGAGVTVLTASVATYCQGQALAQKEAAWEWLRANRATQPLVAPTRAPAPAWPAPAANDVALWAAAAMLVFAPEALPILVGP